MNASIGRVGDGFVFKRPANKAIFEGLDAVEATPSEWPARAHVKVEQHDELRQPSGDGAAITEYGAQVAAVLATTVGDFQHIFLSGDRGLGVPRVGDSSLQRVVIKHVIHGHAIDMLVRIGRAAYPRNADVLRTGAERSVPLIAGEDCRWRQDANCGLLHEEGPVLCLVHAAHGAKLNVAVDATLEQIERSRAQVSEVDEPVKRAARILHHLQLGREVRIVAACLQCFSISLVDERALPDVIFARQHLIRMMRESAPIGRRMLGCCLPRFFGRHRRRFSI